MSASVKRLFMRRIGPQKWKKRVETIEATWQTIQTELDGLGLNYREVRLYQDGLPNCGREIEIVEEMARTGSKNHRILLEMIEKGAVLTGTESPELLMEEYELVRKVLRALESGDKETLAERPGTDAKALLHKRDRYIADRIDKTLKTGETGLIFLGVLHSLEGLLCADIHITFLSKAAQFKEDGEE